MTTSEQLFAKAQTLMPGGVNSPVRAFRSVGGNPIFMRSGKGAFLYDEDGREYIELINSWGPMLLGHAFEPVEEAVREAISQSFSFGAPTRKEVEMAELIVEMVPTVEMVRMVNSGTEATMAAIRVARGATGRDKLIKFEGCYHGHGDSFLIAAGSGVLTLGMPDSPGVTKATAADTLTARYNSLADVEELLVNNQNQVAAIILEPVVGNMGCVLPEPGFLEGLRDLCDQHGSLLIFDEVMTGFRLAKGGAQERFGIRPDLTTMGKVIGGGMPVGAYGGRADLMRQVAPAGPIYQAGTLSGNPIAMSAGLAMLRHLNQNPNLYVQLDNIGQRLADGLRKGLADVGVSYTVNQIGSMLTLFMTDRPVTDFAGAKTCDTALFGRYFQAMLKRGIYLAPSQFESLFLSTALTNELIDRVIEASAESLREVV